MEAGPYLTAVPGPVVEAELDFETGSHFNIAVQIELCTMANQQGDDDEEDDDDDAAAAFDPKKAALVEALTRHITRAQRARLLQTPGHVQGPVGDAPGPGGDQDHDYACYYDYHHDIDSDDGGSSTGKGRKRSHTPYTLDSASRTSTVYQVKCTWDGQGAPPLSSRLDDFLAYMKECHLTHAPSAALPLSLLPANEYAASEMLAYYSRRPQECLTGPVPDLNPVNPKLVDLAYSNPLVLQLIIAQRANHREVSSAMLPTGERAESFYAAAIAEFGPKIDSYLAGHEQDMLPLALGSLVISLTERARLDKRGQAHNYPTAAKSILKMLVSLPHEEICKETPPMLLEYYMHSACFACIAADVTKAESMPFMSEALANAVDDLVAQNYVGKLCGTWLPIMVLIQSTFQLGMEMRPYAGGAPDAPAAGPSTGYTPNHFVTFGQIQERLFNFKPHSDRRCVSAEAATLFRNAAMLYLWSLLEWPHAAKEAGSYANHIESAYADALRQLDRISEISSVNKALCWPLLIVGCFAKTSRVKAVITSRLISISGRFKVGNALETLFVLQHIWSLPFARRSPWTAHKSIRHTKCYGCVCPGCMSRLFT
ncbi:fungal-specific transcription factor domain-containing protein [Trichoderma novae-zelandiae]